MNAPDDGTRQRLDKWIWHARMVRTRSDAAEVIRAGRVRINALRVTQAAKPVKLGDVITVALGQGVQVLRVRAIASRRGSATDAAVLFERLAPDGTPHLPKDSEEMSG